MTEDRGQIKDMCRNQCNFCYYRSANALPVRYRSKASDIIEAAQGLAESGVHLIDLTLAGVAQNSLDIADARRTPASIRLELEKVGMQSASTADYSFWLENRRGQIRRGLSMEKVAC
jgi:biotin synthase-like enzyme